MSGDELRPAGQFSPRKLKLVLKTSPRTVPIDINTDVHTTSKDGSSSPPRPSYSPVTPTGTHESRRTLPGNDQAWIDEPPLALPVSLDDNTDAIALRAALSLLQLQRQQALRDIRRLDKVRDAAIEDPHAFVEDLQAGKLTKPANTDISFDESDEHDEEADLTAATAAERFGKLPNPQNVARCPPIEWSKYHVVGEPLDAMHERQRMHPGSGAKSINGRSSEQDIAAPYQVFQDETVPMFRHKG